MRAEGMEGLLHGELADPGRLHRGGHQGDRGRGRCHLPARRACETAMPQLRFPPWPVRCSPGSELMPRRHVLCSPYGSSMVTPPGRAPGLEVGQGSPVPGPWMGAGPQSVMRGVAGSRPSSICGSPSLTSLPEPCPRPIRGKTLCMKLARGAKKAGDR